MIVNENTFFREATMRICGNLDFEIALQECLCYLRSFMPGDKIEVALYDRGLHALRTIAGATPEEAYKMNLIRPLKKMGREYLESPNLPLAKIINRPLWDPIAAPLVKLEGTGEKTSDLVIFLAIKDARLGNVVLFADGNDRYTEEHLKLFSSLNEPFCIALSNVLRYEEVNRLKDIMADDIRFLHRKLQRFSKEEIIGADFGLKGVTEMVREVAPLDSPVLIQGETGAGKEIIANAIHELSRRKDGPFIPVNCGAIPENLIDSELFGHEKGAFTGAVTRKRGCFERADGGTIFLDEVAELPLQAQVRLLRVLQDKKMARVGGSDPIKVDIRIIAATNQHLQGMVDGGGFRADLWFRLNVFPIMIPPLRKRKEDIPALVRYFIEKKTKELRLPFNPTILPGEMELLMAYSWPGNVRELENVVERALILRKGQPLTFKGIVWVDDNEEGMEIKPDHPEFLKLDLVTARHIRHVLKMAKGKVTGPGGAADLLAVNPGTLRHRMRKLGVPYGRRKH